MLEADYQIRAVGRESSSRQKENLVVPCDQENDIGCSQRMARA
jgi:hypothetical protein